MKKRKKRTVCRSPEAVLPKRLPGNFTIEASVIIPLLFFLIAFALRVAIEQYGEVKELSQTATSLEEIEPADIMWSTASLLEDGLNED